MTSRVEISGKLKGSMCLFYKLSSRYSHVQFAYCFRCPKIFQRFVLGEIDNFSKNIKIKHMIVSVNVPACDIAITTWRVYKAELAPYDNCTQNL